MASRLPCQRAADGTLTRTSQSRSAPTRRRGRSSLPGADLPGSLTQTYSSFSLMQRSPVVGKTICLTNKIHFPATLAATGGHGTQVWPVRCKHGLGVTSKEVLISVPLPANSLAPLFHLPTWRWNSRLMTRGQSYSLYKHGDFWKLS